YMDLDHIWILPPKEEINLGGVRTGSELDITAEVPLDRFETTVILRGITRWPDTLWRGDRPREIRKGIGRAQLRAGQHRPARRSRPPAGQHGLTLHIFDINRAPNVDNEFPVLVLDLSAGVAAFQT
ncbi:MAG: hypothetical protein ABGZ36_14960, partial [Actinomycetota bacterium]